MTRESCASNPTPYKGDGVMVSVADTGAGISSQDIDRIFNPLFTTKSDGMGMGLSICRAIIEAHDGRLWFSPNTPRGAVFQFTLHANNPRLPLLDPEAPSGRCPLMARCREWVIGISSIPAILTSSASDPAPIFFMILPR